MTMSDPLQSARNRILPPPLDVRTWQDLVNDLQSARNRILAPNLDDRTWQDLVNEAVALIPKYAPQWTDQNPSDLGMALVELFAFLVEGLTYRLNRVPYKNYIAFLNLLGITLDPAVPAQVYLTFSAQPAAVVVPKGTQAQTQGTETVAPVVFETDEAVNVLPSNLTTAVGLQKSPPACLLLQRLDLPDDRAGRRVDRDRARGGGLPALPGL